MAKKQPLYPHVPKSRKKPGTEELKSWGELTLQEKLAYARRVVGSGIPGWDNMKAIAYEMGIEPDEDEIPTLFELGKMVPPSLLPQTTKAVEELASRLTLVIEDLQKQAEIVQRDTFLNFADAKKLNKRITDAVDALSDVGVYLRTISVGGKPL